MQRSENEVINVQMILSWMFLNLRILLKSAMTVDASDPSRRPKRDSTTTVTQIFLFWSVCWLTVEWKFYINVLLSTMKRHTYTAFRRRRLASGSATEWTWSSRLACRSHQCWLPRTLAGWSSSARSICENWCNESGSATGTLPYCPGYYESSFHRQSHRISPWWHSTDCKRRWPAKWWCCRFVEDRSISWISGSNRHG